MREAAEVKVRFLLGTKEIYRWAARRGFRVDTASGCTWHCLGDPTKVQVIHFSLFLKSQVSTTFGPTTFVHPGSGLSLS